MATAEAALHSAHVGMASLIGELPDEYTRVQWLGNLDSQVAAVLLDAKRGAVQAQIKEATGVQVRALAENPWAALR